MAVNDTLDEILDEIVVYPSGITTGVEQAERHNQIAIIEKHSEITELKQKMLTQADWTREMAEAHFSTIQQIQSLLNEKLPKDGTMKIGKTSFDLKSNLEMISSLTGTTPRYTIPSEEYSGKSNSCYKIRVECILCKGDIPLGVGTATCSSYDEKEAYEWKAKSEIPAWRWEKRDTEGNYDKNSEEKRIHDYPNNIWILFEDLESKIDDNGNKKYKVSLSIAQFKEMEHKISRKAHVRAWREAVNAAFARTTFLRGNFPPHTKPGKPESNPDKPADGNKVFYDLKKKIETEGLNQSLGWLQTQSLNPEQKKKAMQMLISEGQKQGLVYDKILREFVSDVQPEQQGEVVYPPEYIALCQKHGINPIEYKTWSCMDMEQLAEASKNDEVFAETVELFNQKKIVIPQV